LQIFRIKPSTALFDRYHVVDHHGWHHATTLLARAAQRVLTQESRTHRAPLG
jgi:hypothetical protein